MKRKKTVIFIHFLITIGSFCTIYRQHQDNVICIKDLDQCYEQIAELNNIIDEYCICTHKDSTILKNQINLNDDCALEDPSEEENEEEDEYEIM